MIAAESLIHSTAVVTGAVVSARLLTLKSQPIEKMVAKLDLALAAKVAAIASSDSLDVVEWRNLSLWQLYRQASLLKRIAIELSKICSKEFANIPAEQKCNLDLLRWAVILCVLKDRRRCTKDSHVNGGMCSLLPSHL